MMGSLAIIMLFPVFYFGTIHYDICIYRQYVSIPTFGMKQLNFFEKAKTYREKQYFFMLVFHFFGKGFM